MSNMVRFGVHKLLRDRVPLFRQKDGITIHQKQLDEKSFIAELKKKLLEEAEEVRISQKDTLLEELADVLEVMHVLLNTYNYSWDELEQARVAKKEKRGGFDTQLYVEYVDVPMHTQAYNYLSKNPKKYPIIHTKAIK